MKRMPAIVGTLATATALVTLTATNASASQVKSISAKAAGTSITSFPASGTGGLILRDVNGRDTGSGIGESQDFGFNGCGPKGSGLIRVIQLKRGGGGGWGSAYAGFVKKQYTQAPSMFPCN